MWKMVHVFRIIQQAGRTLLKSLPQEKGDRVSLVEGDVHFPSFRCAGLVRL
jgi:hypothetical protein